MPHIREAFFRAVHGRLRKPPPLKPHEAALIPNLTLSENKDLPTDQLDALFQSIGRRPQG